MVVQTYKFSRRERISRSQVIRQTIHSGQTLSSETCTLYWKQSQAASAQMGVVVSRQAAREAVRRNQLKRWVREFWRLNKSKLSEPVQMIVRFKPNVSAKTSWRFLSDELNALFSKAGLFRHEK